MTELVKAEKCKRAVILNYFGYKVSKRTEPEHTCYEMMGNANSETASSCDVSEEVTRERTDSLTEEQKTLLKGY